MSSVSSIILSHKNRTVKWLYDDPISDPHNASSHCQNDGQNDAKDELKYASLGINMVSLVLLILYICAKCFKYLKKESTGDQETVGHSTDEVMENEVGMYYNYNIVFSYIILIFFLFFTL
jgi:hypothetical protein